MAKFKEWSPALEEALSEPFPSEFLSEIRKGGRPVTVVSWHLYVMRLNELVGPGWSMGEPILKEIGGKLIMGTPVTIFGVTRCNFGSEAEEHGNAEEDGKVRDFGSAETNSFAQSLKRTLALFGMGLSLYDKSGVMVRYKEKAAHDAALDFIRDVGARSDESVILHMTDGSQQPLKDAVRKAWPTVKRERAAAIAFAKAIEDSTGQLFSAST